MMKFNLLHVLRQLDKNPCLMTIIRSILDVKMIKMKRKYIYLFLVFLYFFASGCTAAALEVPRVGESFPLFTLKAPETSHEISYLGVLGKDTFTVTDIVADIVIVEIFNMYCPYCQREAPLINKLYRLIEDNPDLGKKIKLIGIGAGNTDFEVSVFREEYNIPFPLFSDGSFAVHKTVGEVRTPFFFVLSINPDGSNNIIYSKVGSIKNPGQFLDFILQTADIQEK